MIDFQRHLFAADGYIALGLWLEAYDEIESIAPDLRASREAFERREKIYTALKHDELLEVVQNALRKGLPRIQDIIDRSGLHMQERIENEEPGTYTAPPRKKP